MFHTGAMWNDEYAPNEHSYGFGRDGAKASSLSNQSGQSVKVLNGDALNVDNFMDHFDKEILAYVTEDIRLSTLQRKLARETDPEVSLALAFQISAAILSPENKSYVRRAIDIICDVVVEIFYSKHTEEVKAESANALGCVGFVSVENQEFLVKFYPWIWKQYVDAKKESAQIFYLKAISSFLDLKPNIPDSIIERIVKDIQEELEKTENCKRMFALVESLVIVSSWRPKVFEPFFQNVVDILVGWHIDSSQPEAERCYISKVLLSWNSFWIVDIEFSSSLLREFMEDMQAFAADISGADDQDKSKECSAKMLSLLQVFNTVLSCLKTRQNAVTFLPPESSGWCQLILDCLNGALSKHMDEDIVVAGHHALVTLLERIDSLFMQHQVKIMEFVDFNFRAFRQLSFQGQVSVMRFTSKLFTLADGTSQSKLVEHVVGVDSPVLQTAFSRDKRVKEAASDLFRSLLNAKNIIILQEVYSHLTALYEYALVRLAGVLPNPMNQKPLFNRRLAQSACDRLLLFVLSCFSNLATAKGSVLSMWALDPPLFPLLSECSGLLERRFFTGSPWGHLAVLKTLRAHCTSHAHFLSSSTLVTCDSNSPSSGYFARLLSILTQLVNASSSRCGLHETTLLFVLSWCEDLFGDLSSSQLYMWSSKEFSDLAQALAELAKKSRRASEVRAALRLLEVVLAGLPAHEIHCGEFCLAVYQAATVNLRSNDEQVLRSSVGLLSSLPPLLVYSANVNSDEKRSQAALAEGEEDLRAADFKAFVDDILQSPTRSAEPRDIEQTIRRLDAYYTAETKQDSALLRVLSDQQELDRWIGDKLAQFCVSNKLKTPLGKAQDTLTAVEKTIRAVEQTLSSGRRDDLRADGCHRLLTFFDSLEKALTNAFDGSVVSLRFPSKTVASFFAANKTTCFEWLSRVRLPVIAIAFSLGDDARVVRHCQQALGRLQASLADGAKDKEEAQSRKLVMYLAVALCRLQSHEALLGLYAWCKNVLGKKMRWIRGLSELARGRFEEGTSSLNAAIRQVMEGADNADLTSHLLEELAVGYAALSQVDDYKRLLEDYKKATASQPSQEEARRRQLKYLEALSEFNDGIMPRSFKEEKLQDVLTGHVFNHQEALVDTSLLLFQAAASFQYGKSPLWSDGDKKLKLALEKTGENISLLLGKSSRSEIQLVTLAVVHNELEKLLAEKPGNLGSLLFVPSDKSKRRHPSTLLTLIKKWGDYFIKFRKEQPQHYFQLTALNLEIAKSARREDNLDLAKRYLQRSLLGSFNSPTSTCLEDYVSKINFRTAVLSVEKASCLREWAKAAQRSPSQAQASLRTACGLACSIGAAVLQHQHQGASEDLLEVSSRALHNVCAWIRADPSLLDAVYPESSSDSVSVAQVLELEQSALGVMDFLPVTEAASDRDMVLGRILRLSLVQSPHLAKLWNTFAVWCLGVGDKMLAVCEKEGGIALLDEERSAVVEALPSTQKQDLEMVFSLLQHHKLRHSEKAEIETDRVEYMRKELMDCPALRNESPEAVQQIHLIWLDIQKRTFFYHETAVYAFFQFISLCSGSNEAQLIAATLCLLQITVKHALELQESLQIGLESTQSQKWTAIIPQLFARLNHPVRIVRNRISELLCRIATDSPHLIIYPAVVGAATTATDNLSKLLTSVVDDECDGEEEEEHDESESSLNRQMLGAYSKIVDVMFKREKEKGNEESVEQVKSFVNELQRISLLWDELWLGTLQQYSNDMNRRVKRMEEEVLRLERNESLSGAEKKQLVQNKYFIIFKPVLYILEKAHAVTSKPPETPHEVWFASKYGEFINKMLAKLRTPTDPAKPREVWNLLQQLQSNLSNRMLSKTTLKLGDISPALTAVKRSNIPMPGVTDVQSLNIDKFHEDLLILFTKTKPKRVSFYGSDGKSYVYLFKGLEDLHLDERIMQFLSISNILMQSSSHEFRARHYSVVPLGPRSGLIQWVMGAIPMYSFFKKWQQRQQLGPPPAEKKGASSDQKKQNWSMKPSEMFYNKLLPLLRESGITNLENRKAWPLSMLRQVMQELIREMPSSLLAHEIWFSSGDARQWLAQTQRMTRSIAVMCIIGYIIGLGDRHLENLLVDLEGGEVIHIDYNICFEKGKNLRIPERVPCRLTQNLVKALGLTGVDGLFRHACEHILGSLRKGRETLLMLLEAFVYDPLVDWTPGVELGITGAYHGGRQNNPELDLQDQRNMQSEITFSMLNVRVAEIKAPWAENQINLSANLSQVLDRLASWLDVMSAIESLTDQMSSMHHAMAVLKEAQANPAHRLFGLYDRYVEHNLTENAVQIARRKLAHFEEENERWINLHHRALNTVTQNQLLALASKVSEVVTNASLSSDLVSGFLEQAGQSTLFGQMEAAEGGFCVAVEKLKQNLHVCIELLVHYANVSSLYPQSSRSQHRNVLYMKWARQMAESFKVASCQQVAAEFAQRFVEGTDQRRLEQHHVASVNYQMELSSRAIGERLRGIFQRMKKEGIVSSGAVQHELVEEKDALRNSLQQESSETRQLFNDLLVGGLAAVNARLAFLEDSAKDDSAEALMERTILGNERRPLLDEIEVMLAVVVHHLDVFDLLSEQRSLGEMAAQSLYKLNDVFKQLQHLSSSFYKIIMQEGLKCFQREEPSVITVALQISELTSKTRLGQSLEGLIQDLDDAMKCSGTPNFNETSVVVARSVVENFNALMKRIARPLEGETLSQGQMLLLAFDSLLNNVDNAMRALRERILFIHVEEQWLNVDVLSRGRNLSEHRLLSDHSMASADLSHLVNFLNRLVLIRDFFTQCTLAMLAFKADPASLGQTLPTGDDLARPVKIFICDYYRRYLAGAGSYALAALVVGYITERDPTLPLTRSEGRTSAEDLAGSFAERQIVRHGKSNGHFLSLERQNLSKLIVRLETARSVEQSVEALNCMRQLWHAQRSSFQWFHEGDLPSESVAFAPPLKAKLLEELRHHVQLSVLGFEELVDIQKKYHELHSVVEQRLKWACGANPDLQETFNAYSTSFASEMEWLRSISGSMKTVTGLVNSILHHEALRSQTREAVASDSAFMALLGECQQSAALSEAQGSALSEHDLQLFALNPPADSVDAEWIKATEVAISNKARVVQEQLRAEQAKAQQSIQAIKESSKDLRATISVHQKLMTDVGTLLRTIAKSEDYDIPEVADYLARYKEFSELITTLVKETVLDEQTGESVKRLAICAERLKDVLDSVYEDVIGFAQLLREENLESFKVKRGFGGKAEGGGNGEDKKKTTEEKNAFAINVLRRVRTKLDGREPDSLKKASVAEQVDFIIREATSIDNLALMYEGWTAWI